MNQEPHFSKRQPGSSCESVEPWLTEFLVGDVPASVRASVEGHVAGCSRCSSQMAEWGALMGELAAIPVRGLDRKRLAAD